MRQLFDLNGKKILITGASSGIGRACAILCSQLGAQVALVARNEGRLIETSSHLEGVGHLNYICDVQDFDKVKVVIQQIANDFGPIDGFIHSAGVSNSLPVKMLTPEKINDLYKINAIAAFEIGRLVSRKGFFNEQGCSMVFIASVMAIIAEKTKLAYCASKSALLRGSQVLALELSSKKIRVNCVSPGMVMTELLEGFSEKLEARIWNSLQAKHPLGLGTPSDVAYLVCFLLSDASKWVTASNLIVDGGYSCK